jgi:hypothetical protein
MKNLPPALLVGLERDILDPERVLDNRSTPMAGARPGPQRSFGRGYVTAECAKVVDAAYSVAGSASLSDTSSLQRRLRDIHAATQHGAATGEGYRTMSALLVAEELSAMDLF